MRDEGKFPRWCSALLRRGGALAIALIPVALLASASAGTTPPRHACGDSATSANCPRGQARFCASSGAFVGCGCPAGGALATTIGGALPAFSCVVEPSASVPPPCTVASAPAIAPSTVAETLAAGLEVGELENPSLDSFASPSAEATVARLDAKLATLSADELVRLAAAHDALEGASAGEAAATLGARHGTKIIRRDGAVARGIEVRRAFLLRFATDPRADDERVRLARSLLRRAVYMGSIPDSDADRVQSRRLVDTVAATASSVQPTAKSSAVRDATFMLAEAEVRAHAWAHVTGLESEVLRLATMSLRADDPPYVAAAHGRLAQAHLALQSPLVARGSLASAIEFGDLCAPRRECVSVATAARSVLAETWVLLASPARTMVPLLIHPSLTAVERRGPLLRLATLWSPAGVPVSSACDGAIDEARAWADVLR